jgi:hypothetical protein
VFFEMRWRVNNITNGYSKGLRRPLRWRVLLSLFILDWENDLREVVFMEQGK